MTLIFFLINWYKCSVETIYCMYVTRNNLLLPVDPNSIDAQGSSAQILFLIFLPFCFILPCWSVCSVPLFGWIFHKRCLWRKTIPLKIISNEWKTGVIFLQRKNNLQISFFNNLGISIPAMSGIFLILYYMHIHIYSVTFNNLLQNETSL